MTALQSILEASINNLVVDVTTFTHESLLILVKHLHQKRSDFAKVTFLYLGASDYCSKETKTELKWLSKGCRDLRTVLGYPGWMKPGVETCLTVLVGYEHERATRMISEMEPELLFLGAGSSETHPNHRAPMEHFRKLVSEMVATRYNVQRFEFSCSKPRETVQILNQIIDANKGFNHIIVPLNTKVSTVAAAVVALNNSAVQLCYAEPETYNTGNYATPGNEVSCWDLRF